MCTAILRTAKTGRSTRMRSSTLAGCISAAVLTVAAPGFASGLTLNSVPASSAASQVAHAFNTNVILGSGVNLGQTVSFSLADTSSGGGRASAIAYLAHQLNANQQTVLVVGRSNGTAWKAPAALDTTANVTFNSRTLPAVSVMHQIAYVDNADVQYDHPLTGTVTLSALTLPATEAARELAEQTHSSISVIYTLTGIGQRPVVATGSTIIGYTAGGQPITKSVIAAPPAPRMYAHRTETRSTARSSTNTTAPTTSVPAVTGLPTIIGSAPATVLQSPATPTFHNLPNNGVSVIGGGFGGFPTWWPYEPLYSWQAPYNVGPGGVIITP